MDDQLPDFLQPVSIRLLPKYQTLPPQAPHTPVVPSVKNPHSARSTSPLVNAQFENMFEHILDKVSAGISVMESLRDDNRPVDPGMFFRWINRDAKRKQRFQEAQEIGTEVIAAEMVDIADGKNSIEDVQRSTLRINTRKFLVQSWNRKRYGESKQIELNQSISITDALSAANGRLRTMETIEDAEYVDSDTNPSNTVSHPQWALPSSVIQYDTQHDTQHDTQDDD